MSTVAPSGHPPSSPPSRIVGGSGKKEGIDSGRKKSRKSSIEGDWRRCTQTLLLSLVKGEGETGRDAIS